MLDKYLKIFGLDNNFSLDELEGKYKKLLKEFDTKNIEDDLKVIFLEEQVKIREAYQILLKFNHTREKVNSIKSKGKTLRKGDKKKTILAIIMTLCALLLLALGFSGVFTAPATEEVVVEEVVVEDESIDVDSIVDEVLEEIEEVEEVVKRKPKVKPTCDTKVFENMKLKMKFARWEMWDSKPNDIATERYDEEVQELKELIQKYKDCRCSKCENALKDKNLKRLIVDFIKYL